MGHKGGILRLAVGLSLNAYCSGVAIKEEDIFANKIDEVDFVTTK